MYSQEQLQLLLHNPIVQELLDILENEGKCVLKHLDLSHVDEVFEQQKSTNRGRPWTYTPSDKLKAFLYGLSEGKDSIHGVARTVQTSVAQVFLGLEQGGMSYTTLERFWHQFAVVAETVFKELVVTMQTWEYWEPSMPWTALISPHHISMIQMHCGAMMQPKKSFTTAMGCCLP